jgi:virginiamycin B lyase
VQRVDTDFNTVGDPIDTTAGRAVAGSIAVGFGSIFFASANSVVERLDPDSRKVTATLFSGSSPSGIAVDARAVWVANQASNDVYEFSPSTNQPIAKPPVPGGPTAITTGGGWVWVAVGGFDSVTRIDPLSGAAVNIPVGKHPSAIAYGAGAVWVTNAGDGTVSRIDPTKHEVTKTITVGNDPEGIVVSENLVWVAVQAR